MVYCENEIHPTFYMLDALLIYNLDNYGASVSAKSLTLW